MLGSDWVCWYYIVNTLSECLLKQVSVARFVTSLCAFSDFPVAETVLYDAYNSKNATVHRCYKLFTSVKCLLKETPNCYCRIAVDVS